MNRGTPATAMQLDYLLWNRGQEPRYKRAPRHRTRVFYEESRAQLREIAFILRGRSPRLTENY